MKNYIVIIRDHSGSMSPHKKSAAADYNIIIEGIKAAAIENGIDTIVSVVECGVGYEAKVRRDVVLSSVTRLKPIIDYRADGSGTPLWDSVGNGISLLSGVPDSDSPEVSFLVMAITDGQENRSNIWRADQLRVKIHELQGTDRWSFAFRVPVGYASTLQSKLGIPAGNILEWEQTTEGFERAAGATATAFRSYTASLAQGQRSTQRFYSDLSGIKPSVVRRELVNISDKVVIWNVTTPQPVAIKAFCEAKNGEPYVKGRAYYELAKTETVQDYKELIIRHKRGGAVYSGHAARDLLGLPLYGSFRLSPGDHGDYELFVQSTSLNRVLHPGSKLLYVVKP
jgi:hypothetical protein